MNWAAIAVGISALTLVTTIVAASYTHGQLTQQVRQNSEDIDDVEETLETHGERLNNHDVEIGRLQEWKAGFNTAARLTGTKEMA